MRFEPVKQINAILRQEYFEPTISWALRVVFALNVPLLLLPLMIGYKREIMWTAFTAYLLSLLDFRGPHHQKIFIQIAESFLIAAAAFVGMNTSGNILLAVIFTFAIGMFAALIRNWSDYGASVGVATGFFYLFGLANAGTLQQSLHTVEWIAFGAAWALFITLVSFPFQLTNPLKRSVAAIWKHNTELLDSIIEENLSAEPNFSNITEQEIAVRTSINKSIELFKRRTKTAGRIGARHYDIIIDLRRTSSLFGASVTSLHDELKQFNGKAFEEIKSSVIYKTLSAYAQASARIAIVIFTNSPDDMEIAKVRVKRCAIALNILKDTRSNLSLNEKEAQAFDHFVYSLELAHGYLDKAIQLLEEKMNLTKGDQLEEYKVTFNNFLSGMNPNKWIVKIRQIFNVNSQQFMYALRVAFAVSLGVFLYEYFNINHGYWIPLTILIVIQPYYGATFKRGLERTIGTIAGIIGGGIINLLNLPHGVFVGLMIIVSFCVVYFIRHNYKVGVFFITLMIVVMMHLSAQASWTLIGWRLFSTLIGALLAVIAGYAFWPVWEKQRFPALMSAALLQNKKYLAEVLNPTKENEWIRKRNLAEAANSDVFACVQRMQDEPQHIRKRNDHNFDIVGINIRITREITSIALGIQSLNDKASLSAIDQYLNQVSEIFDALNAAILKQEDISLPDFQNLKTVSLPANETYRFIKIELEKIIFELETMSVALGEDKNEVGIMATKAAH